MPLVSFKGLLLDDPYKIAAGRVPGVEIIKKFGFNPLVGSIEETIWDNGGLYQYTQTPQLLTISSTSEDDVLGDSGVYTATVYGLDENYDAFELTVSLNGLNPVTVVPNGIRVYRVTLDTGGATGASTGTVYVGYGAVVSGIPTNILALVRSGFNQTQMAVYTVPAGKIAFIGDYYNNTGEGKDATIESYARKFGELFQLKRIVSAFENNFYYPNRAPFFFEEKTDFEIRALSSAAGAPVSAGFDIILVDKDRYI